MSERAFERRGQQFDLTCRQLERQASDDLLSPDMDDFGNGAMSLVALESEVSAQPSTEAAFMRLLEKRYA